MGSLLTYSGITTKIRAMERRIITPEDYGQLAQLATTTEFIAFLKKQPGYYKIFENYDESALHRGQIELLLKSSLYLDFASIYLFASGMQRNIMTIIFFRYEIDFLKLCLQRIYSTNKLLDLTTFYTFFSQHSKLHLDELVVCSSIDELTNHLKDTEYYAIFARLQGFSLHDYEAQLDIYYFKKIWKIKNSLKSKEERRFITEIIGTEIDLLNILWIYRSKKFYDLDFALIYASIIPCHYKLSQEMTERLAESGTTEEFLTLLQSTHYGGLFKDTGPGDMEYTLRTVIDALYRKSSQVHPSSMAPILYYLHLKEMELDHLTTALECIRYKLEPEQTLSFVLGTNQSKRR